MPDVDENTADYLSTPRTPVEAPAEQAEGENLGGVCQPVPAEGENREGEDNSPVLKIELVTKSGKAAGSLAARSLLQQHQQHQLQQYQRIRCTSTNSLFRLGLGSRCSTEHWMDLGDG
eukprot:3730608-Amphidinium_carterae.5